MSNTTSTTNAASAAAATGGGDITDAVILQINIFIFGLVSLVILLRLPQLVGLLHSRSGRPFFQLLSSAEVISAKKKMTKQKSYAGDKGKRWEGSEDSHANLVVLQEGKAVLHIPSAPSFVTPLINLLRANIFPGYSAMQVAILLTYFSILLYAAFRESNPFTDGDRAAWIAVSQLPLVFALAQKSSILGSLLGYGYESLNFIHRFAGRLVVLGANIHGIYHIYKSSNAGPFSATISIPKNAWGLVLLLSVDILCFFSISFWRRKAYNVFRRTHTVSVFVIIPAASLHRPALQPYVAACVVIYALDRIMRLVKTRVATATITNLQQLNVAYIEVPTINSGWRAGQHVRLRILSSSMGLFGWTESHPFTIASTGGSHEGLVLLCKQSGDWTKRLVDLSKKLGKNTEDTRKLKVWIEGPFGGPSRMVFASFSAAVLIVGGSGITFGLSMLEELVMKDTKSESRLKYIELVWVVPDPASIAPLIPLFSSLILRSESTTLKITIHYTRALTEKALVFGNIEVAPYTPIAIVHPNLTLTPGRPKFKNIMNTAIGNALVTGLGKPSLVTGLAVGICGPLGLGEAVVKGVAEIDAKTRYRVGGVEIHEETFGF